METFEELEELHNCNLCPYYSKYLFSMSRHIQKHYSLEVERFGCENSIEIYFCRTCEFSSHNGMQFCQHSKQKFAIRKTKKFECPYCFFKTTSALLFLKHHRTYHIVSTVKENVIDLTANFHCAQCDRKFYQRKNLLLHVRTHQKNLGAKSKTDSKPERFKCEQCDYKTKFSASLKWHILYKHTSSDAIKWFKCEKCDYKSKRKGDLKTHTYTKHTDPHDIDWFKCKQCDYKSYRSTALKMHIANNHTSGNNTSSNFGNQSLLKALLKKKTAQLRQCLDCEYSCVSSRAFRYHRLKVHETDKAKWLHCEHCEFKSLDKSRFKRHNFIKHTDPDKVQWVKCEQCDYKAKRKQTLDRHMIFKHTEIDIDY